MCESIGHRPLPGHCPEMDSMAGGTDMKPGSLILWLGGQILDLNGQGGIEGQTEGGTSGNYLCSTRHQPRGAAAQNSRKSVRWSAVPIAM